MIFVILSIILYIMMGSGIVLIKKGMTLYDIRSKKFLYSKYFISGIIITASSGILLKIPLFYMNLSDQFPLSILFNITIIILGILYLKEKLNRKNIVVIILTITGLFFILVTNFLSIAIGIVIGLAFFLLIILIYKNSKDIKTFIKEGIDIRSFGHALFGFITGTIFVLIFQLLPNYYDINLYLSTLCVLVFISWEILEETIVKKYIYVKIFKMKNWYETLPNSFLDIIIGTLFFYLAFIPLYIIHDINITIIIHVISFALIPIVVFILPKIKIKW